jgi:hypothetical protein
MRHCRHYSSRKQVTRNRIATERIVARLSPAANRHDDIFEFSRSTSWLRPSVMWSICEFVEAAEFVRGGLDMRRAISA